MIDILNKIYSVLKDDEKLMKILDIKNVKFNDYPDVKDITKPYVVLDDFDDPIPEVHYDGERAAYSYIVQIDVFVKANPDYNARVCVTFEYLIVPSNSSVSNKAKPKSLILINDFGVLAYLTI